MSRRIALLGMALESNAFAPAATEADFRQRLYLTGDAVVAEARKPVGRICMEMTGFVRTMDAIGGWEPVPILYTDCEPAGPVTRVFFEQTLETMTGALRQSGPVDAVFVANHGAMTAEHDTDPDGLMLTGLREVVGDEVPIVVTLDLHANISDRMATASDIIIGYQTNPHVDMYERGEEAALTTVSLLNGLRAHQVLIRLPLTPASVTLLTADGPYGQLIDYGQRRKRELGGQILNVSVFGGFVFSDTPDNGLAIVVTGRNERRPAFELATDIAAQAWAGRSNFRKTLTTLERAQALAEQSSAGQHPPVLFSDAGDNPGGGGSGNTTALLEAMVSSAAENVLFGSLFDPELATEAHALGAGAHFDATLNRSSTYEHARTLQMPATVIALGDGQVTGRRGIYANRALNLGPTCALRLGERGNVTLVLTSQRIQTADPVFFEQFSLDIGAFSTVCVKSRGHFRAGFDQWFSPRQIFEIDTAGLTAPVLSRFEWKGLPRPSYPLDEDTHWTPPTTSSTR